MRKFTFCLVLITTFVSQQIAAQLYVNNNYLYVADNFLYVRQDVNLNTAGNIYLRNESHLLQGTTGSSTNQGVGSLSVFQEGTSNNYTYNYWSSPVGEPSGLAGNSLFGVSLLNRPTGLISSTPATMLASGNLDGSTNDTPGNLSIAQRWVFRFLSQTTYSQWLSTGASTSIAAGQGFTMKGTSGTDGTIVIGVANNPGSQQRYDFKGRPNDGNIPVSVIGTAGNMTLTGNPYPSPINLDMFLTDPANAPFIDGTALFWEHDPSVTSHLIASYRGGYGIYNGTTGMYSPATFYTYDAAGNQGPVFSTPLNHYERKFCPVAQGFMVRGTNAGTVYFKNAYRVSVKESAINQSQFHRTASNGNRTQSNTSPTDYGFYEAIPNVAGIDYTQISKAPTPHITINASLNNQAVRQIALGFMPTAIDGLDRADSKSSDSNLNLPFDMYFYLDNAEYIQSVTSFDINKRFPVGFKNTSEASFRIQVVDFINFDQAQNVYLFDKQTGIYHDIKNVEYEMTLPTGVYNDRFEFTFVDGALNVPTITSDTFDVVQNNNTHQLMIANPKLIDVKSVTLYDIAGKRIFDKVELGAKSSYQFPTASISDAVYIVKIVTAGNEEFSRKVTVYNGK